MTFELIMRGVAVVAAAFVLWRVTGLVSIADYRINHATDYLLVLTHITGAYLLVSWAIGPEAGLGALTIGTILATSPWDLLRARRSATTMPTDTYEQAEADHDEATSVRAPVYPTRPDRPSDLVRRYRLRRALIDDACELTPEERDAWDDLVRRLT